jgi:predicted ester cyclase
MSSDAAKMALERNKAVGLRFKKSQGTPQQEQTLAEVLHPDYQRVRGGALHLESNAHGASFPGPGKFLRTAFPDRVDVMEDVIAEGDRVGLLFKVTATHKANFLGIPETGKKVAAYECAMLRVVEGRMVEGWFMMDEAGLLGEFGSGTGIPRRPDGARIAPVPRGDGEEAAAVVKRLKSGPLASPEARHRLVLAQAAASRAQPGADGHQVRREPFRTLAAYGQAHGAATQHFAQAFPDWQQRINLFIAEGDRVWMRSTLVGTHTAPFYGIAATGRRVEVPQLTIAQFVNGKWEEGWYLADELGLLLQLGAADILS